jgi:AraC-like DNA-binding protein
MGILDKKLSLIDSVTYTQAQRPADMPSFLDVARSGRLYRYELLFANLHESYQSAQMPSVPHAHPVFHIVLYTGGGGFLRIADQLQRVEDGVLVVIPPAVPHAFTPPGGHVAYHALTFALMAGDQCLDMNIDSLLAHYTGSPVSLAALTRPDATTFALLRRRMELLVNALQSQPIDWLQHQQHMIALFALLGNVGTTSAPAPGLVDQAQALLDARFADPSLSLQSLAHELHTTPENLCRQFRQKTGGSPIQYRNRLRTQAACALLRNTNLPCKAIADRLGYSDLYTFSKAYRRTVGHSPVQERRHG